MDRVLTAFLAHQEELARGLTAGSDRVAIDPFGGRPPYRYLVKLLTRGLVRTEDGTIREAEGCRFGISFPDDYLVRQDRLDAPLAMRVITYLGPHPRPWHPNILEHPPHAVCLHVRPGTPLIDLVFSLNDLWTWNAFATGDDGLNPAASQWARNGQGRAPVDRRPLRRRGRHLAVRMTEIGGDS